MRLEVAVWLPRSELAPAWAEPGRQVPPPDGGRLEAQPDGVEAVWVAAGPDAAVEALAALDAWLVQVRGSRDAR